MREQGSSLHFFTSSRPHLPSSVVILIAWLLTGPTGCAHRCYRASNLPAELVAPVTESVDTAMLSRLAQHTAGGELIDRGDLLDVTIDSGYGEEPARTMPVWVEEDGTARIPLIGEVTLAGLTLQDAGRVVAAAGVERGMYVPPYPFVTVEMKEQRTNQVRVIGAVNELGVKQLPRGSSYLLPALVAAGNLTESAGPNIEIIHCGSGSSPYSRPPTQVADGFRTELTALGQPGAGPPTSVHVNLASATKTGQADYYLGDQDVVIVHEREPRSVYVMGLVHKPDEYELPPNKDVRVLEALAMAGGRTWEVADKVWVIRQRGPNEGPVRIEVDVGKAKRDGPENLRLMAGDVVTVEETPLTFTLDFLKNFIRLGASMPLY